jgi:hypothetical protein
MCKFFSTSFHFSKWYSILPLSLSSLYPPLSPPFSPFDYFSEMIAKHLGGPIMYQLERNDPKELNFAVVHDFLFFRKSSGMKEGDKGGEKGEERGKKSGKKWSEK